MWILLSPALVHSTQYLGEDLPERLATGQDNSNTVMQDTLLPLLADIERIEDQTHAEIADNKFDRVLSVLNPTASRRGDPSMHQMLRYKALEAMLWSFTGDSSLPMQECSTSPPTELSENSKKIHEGYSRMGVTEWDTTMKHFTNTMIRGAASTADKHDDLTTSESDQVLVSLLSCIRESEKNMYYSSVVSNFCGAAIAVRAISLVR